MKREIEEKFGALETSLNYHSEDANDWHRRLLKHLEKLESLVSKPKCSCGNILPYPDECCGGWYHDKVQCTKPTKCKLYPPDPKCICGGHKGSKQWINIECQACNKDVPDPEFPLKAEIEKRDRLYVIDEAAFDKKVKLVKKYRAALEKIVKTHGEFREPGYCVRLATEALEPEEAE